MVRFTLARKTSLTSLAKMAGWLADGPLDFADRPGREF
jgi:hypothetical protein